MEIDVRTDQSPERVFRIGVVGASREAFGALTRIFGVTRYRTRSYQPVPMKANIRKIDDDIDFIILCTNNPNILNYWVSGGPSGKAMERPLVRVARSIPAGFGGYLITVPVNPSKLLKLLDQYTIKELKFFPEFERSESGNKAALEGLSSLNSPSKNQTAQGLKKALIVDGSPAVRKQLEAEFAMLGASVDCVATAEEAIIIASQKAYDIIFIDVVMSGMDAYAACKRVKRCLLNKHTPVVLLTNKSSSYDKIRGALAGCDSYLVKPVSHHDLESVISIFFLSERAVAK